MWQLARDAIVKSWRKNRMEKLRNYLLENNLVELYELVLSFMRNPSNRTGDKVLAACPEHIQEMAALEMDSIKALYQSDRREYDQQYTYGQVIIWELVLTAYKRLSEQKTIINQLKTPQERKSFIHSENELKELLIPYAKMQVILSELEESLGVDRYLDRICEDTFSVLNSILASAKEDIEDKSKVLKKAFQAKWGNDNVFNVLASSLVQRNNENQICDLFSSNNDQVLFLLVDGFGFCQYLWNSEIDTKNEHYTFNENIFYWLRRNHLIREHIVGSAYISDTGAGLAQIFLGQLSKETGIYASKIKNKGSGRPFIETKRITENQFDTIFDYHNSITDIITVLGEQSEVYYCSRLTYPLSGFSKAIFKSANIEQVLPPERVFALILDKMIKGMNSGLQVVYFTGIDNSGHTMGAYSRFERMEHIKIDTLLKNYLVELAISAPALFDGKRSIILSADHGMFESSKIMVDRNDLQRFLERNGVFGIKMVENNRALLIYNEGPSSQDKIKTVLTTYFNSNGLKVDITCDTDANYNNHISNTSFIGIRPDFIIRFIGKGLFYSNPNINEHLLHFGGHGGCSVDEVFVPLLEIPLSKTLLEKIQSRFISKK